MLKKWRSVIALILAINILFALVGCQNSADDGQSGEVVDGEAVGDNFFTDNEVILDDGEKNSDASGDNDDKTQSSANIVGGKTWKQVLAAMPKTLKGSTITVYNWNPANEYSGASTVIKKFTKETGIKVKWQTENYDTYISKWAALVAADTAPDVVRLRTPDSIGLTSIQPISVTGYDFNDDAWDKVLMKDYTINGKTYGVSLKNTHIGSVSMILYNKSLISKYDLEDPYQLWKKGKWTWGKFKEMCRTYKKESKSEFACGASEWSAWSTMYGIEGPVGFDGSKYYNRTGDAKFISVSQQIADLYNKERIFADWKSDEFNKGECLFWAGASVYARRSNAYFAALKTAGTLNVVPFPTVEGQDKYYQARDEYEAYGISKGAKNAAAAPYFLRYFLDGSNYDLKSFFCSNQALEVYNWCMSQENTVWTTYYSMNLRFYGGGSDAFNDGYKGLTGDQFASFLKSNSSVIDARVDKFNKALKDK